MGEDFYRHTWVEVDLDAISANVNAFRKHLPEQTKLMAVVKADGYGHGAIPVAEEALAAGVQYLGVATLDEALELRAAGIDAPILVMGYTAPPFLEIAALRNITLTVFDLDVIAALDELTRRLRIPVKIHLKVDSGMGRIGVRSEAEFRALISAVDKCPLIVLEGAFTHFSCADEVDSSYSEAQHHTFMRVIQNSLRSIPIIHCNNSAAGIMFPSWGYNMVRLGISLYGQYPSPQARGQGIELTAAFALKSKISYVKDVSKGTFISYGATYQTTSKAKIASIPIGYADGYSRALSNRGKALVGGQKVSVVGRICMDQCMLDVSNLSTCFVGDEVVLIGRQGNAIITVDDVAELLQTINYEVTCMISRRVPRVYKRNGSELFTKNYLL
ncbi:alanine racemase [Ammoniphilus oxalaticus]|uniref:Alanine racemase n=1 Tax=Ammoniphilus oxalaticus TaxID=66863 RepID=A0A419SFR6_9BACL|nr:alanine racemase [Ammoniphilus oxalaticus]RKD22605.1 alanine racemase [Ammoniphilus oxalaticus]